MLLLFLHLKGAQSKLEPRQVPNQHGSREFWIHASIMNPTGNLFPSVHRPHHPMKGH